MCICEWDDGERMARFWLLYILREVYRHTISKYSSVIFIPIVFNQSFRYWTLYGNFGGVFFTDISLSLAVQKNQQIARWEGGCFSPRTLNMLSNIWAESARERSIKIDLQYSETANTFWSGMRGRGQEKQDLIHSILFSMYHEAVFFFFMIFKFAQTCFFGNIPTTRP